MEKNEAAQNVLSVFEAALAGGTFKKLTQAKKFIQSLEVLMIAAGIDLVDGEIKKPDHADN